VKRNEQIKIQLLLLVVVILMALLLILERLLLVSYRVYQYQLLL